MSITKKNIILAAILCVSITLIGVSFAYFVSSVNITGGGSEASGTTASLIKVSYDAGSSSLNLENAIPGDLASKQFSVKVTPTTSENSVTYAVVLDITNNNFEKCTNASNGCALNANELTYTLKGSDGGTLASGDLTEATGKILLLKETKTVDVETTFNYTLEITYVETNADQTHNANKVMTGNIKVEFAEQ